MKNLYTESSYDRNERPRAFPFYQDYQQNTYFAPNQGTEENLLFDPKGVSDPMNWGATPKFTREPTEAESRTLNQIQSLAFANVLNNSLVTLGKDPSQGLYLRQLIGQAAMQPVAVADEDINEAGIAREQTRLNDLMAQPEDRLQQSGMGDLITQSMSKLAYMKARHNNTLVVPDTNVANYYRGQGVFGNIVGGVADMVMAAYDTVLDFNFGSTAVLSPNAVPAMQRIGGDGLRVLRSMGFNNTELLSDLEKETGGLPSTSTADMVALVESFDRNFDYKTWFNETIALDPTVRDGLLNYGVTEDLFIQSRNSTHALMTLMSKMNVSDIQRRLSNYVPTTYQSIYGFAASFKDGLVGSLDTAAEIALEIGGTVAVDAAIGAGLLGAPTAGGAAPVGAVVGGAVGLAKAGQILYKGLSAAKKVMSSAWYLTGYGKLPRYAMQWGVIRTTGASALVGATANSLIDYVGQKENIALANSLYFYNPDMQATVSMDEVVGAAAAGALFGASLGMVGHVISTVAVRGNNAAARNAFAQQGIDPAFAPQQRNPFQRTADNIAAFRNRKAVAIQDPIAGAIQTAVSKGADPTVVDINSAARTTSTAIDAASVASNPKDAANLPDHSLNRRQANEPMRAYTIRAVMGKFVTSVNDLLDADSAGGRFSQLTPREQYLTLLRTEDHMRDFSTMTDIETDLNNKVAGRPEQMRIIDPVTGRSSSPAANVAKLYAELDAAKSTLEKTISKEDRADATLAHKNGTELAPRTISSAVDKAASNVRGIMENASEGRHNPSEAKGPKVESQATTGSPATGNAAQGNVAPAKPLYGFDAQWAMAKKAKDMGVDLTKMTREEYAQFAIDNGFLIDDNQLRMATALRAATSMAEYQALRGPNRASTNPVHAKLDQAFAVFAANIKKLAKNSATLFEGISVRKGTSTSDTWLYFKINTGANASKVSITHKAYIGFNNVYTSLTPDRLYAFMQELRDKGFQGDLKVMQDLDQASSISDQVVMHGSTEADAALALREAQIFFGKEVVFAEVGVDSGGKSYSENLAAKIKDGIAAKEQASTALPTQKKVDEITQDAAADMSLLTDEELEDPKVTGAIERNVTRQLFGGQKEHTLRSLSRGLAKARKLTLEQQGKINSTLDSPRSFIQQATGNPTYIKNFYDRLEALVGLGHITDIDRRIILASTVNTPFNSNVAAKISDMGTRGDDRASTSLQGDIKIGKLDTSVAGNTRVENVLHEIGHVEELHAYGQSLMDLRKLFKSEQAFLDAAQQVLGTDNFNKYYIAGNTQELMAQVKAKMMIDEVRLAVFLKTAGSTAVEKTLLAHVLRIGTSLMEVFTSLKLSKVDAEDGMYTAVKEILSKLETGAKPLMTRIVYQQRVAGALKNFPTGKLSPEQKVAFVKELNTKITEGFSKVDMVGQNMLFLDTEVESLHALTAHSDGSIDPIRLDAYLNVKREGITVKAKAKFAKTFQSYVEINQRYLASTTDIYIASMKENGYKAVPANPIVMDASLSKRDQIAALREYHRELAPDEMVVTPSYMDVTFGNFNGDLALQFLIDSSTEPTLMMAPGSSLANPEIMNVKVAEFAQKHFGNRKAKNGSLVSENFMRWFGDSKVVDAEGNPLVVYHGTDSIVNFTSFKESVTGRYGRGNYFATKPTVAEKFIRDTSDNNKERKPRIIPVFVSIKKPYVTIKDEFFVENMLKELGLTIEDYYKKAKEIHAKTFTKMDRLKGKSLEEFDDAKPAAITELLQDAGFDGIQVNFKKGDSYFIAFDSSQSKSSIANSGDFGIAEPDIMFAPKVKPSVAYTPELVVQRLAFLSTNLKDAPATAADFKKAMQGMLGLDDDLFNALSTVKGTVSPEQMAGYHQLVIRRVVDALMAGKVAVGPQGVRRLNLVEREMNLVRASKQTEGTKAAKLERARTEPVEDMPADTTDSKLYPNNPMTATMLENFWQDSTTFKQVAARLKASSSLNDQGVLDAISDAMLKVKAKGIAILVDAKGEVRSRNALINYIVVSAKNANLDAKGLKVSRAGLTPDSWKDFLEIENDILRSSGEEEITFNGTTTQHMAAEKKKKGSELYARFKKAYAKSYIEGGEDGAVTGATYTQAAEPKVSQIKAEGLSIMVDYATRLEYNLYSTRDGGWQKFVVTNLMEGKSYAEIVALAKENGFPNKKAGNVADAIDAVRSKFRKMLEEKTGVSLKDMSDDEVMASGVLDSLEELAKAADSARETAPVEDLAPERKSSSEILAETEKSAIEQTNSDELTAALDTKEPTSQPVIAPEGSKGPVTAVVQVDGEAVGPLTPHVAPKTAEAVAKNPKTPKARFTSSTPKKVVVFTTGDARAMLKATGNVGKLFFASMKTMEGLLNALPKSALKDTDIGATIKILKKMIAAGEEKAAVAKFLALMKHLDIEAVKVIDPKDGRTVMNFIFAEQAWSYGGISRFKAAPKKATAAPKKTVAEPKTAEPKTTEPKTAEPKTAEAAPVDTPTEAAPDGTQVPVMEPKAVQSNEIAGGTVVPVVSEHDRIVTGLTEGNEALRDGGVDATSFTALFKKFVRSLSKDAKKKLGTVLPEEFKDLFMKFVELNAAIMHDNRTIFGDSKIVQKFWKQVDTMLAVEDGLQMKDQMRVRLTMKEIYAMAAAQVSTKQHRFLPPLTHENITIKNGKFGLRDVSKETQGVLARRDTGPIIAYTPEEIAARKTAAAPAGPIGPVVPPKQPKRPPTVEEILDETFNPENDPKVAAEAEAILQDSDRLDSIFKRVSTSFSQLLRQNNLVSWFLGGSERSNRNRWRKFMSNTVGFIQHGSKLSSTVRSMDAKVRFFAMFMDDSRAMTGQLVSPDGTPVRSAAKSKQEAVMFTANLTRIHHALAAEAAVLKMTPAERKMLQRLQIEAWQRKTTPTAQEMSAALGGKDFGKMAGILENYRKEMLHLNTEMLKLEEKTGWRTVTKNGKPVEADAYLPVQLHIQKLMSVMGDNKAYENLLRSIIATRRAAKMADSQLDKNTLITMGIMNLVDNSKFYTQDRTFALTDNITLDADTLKKLEKYTTTTTESKDFTKTLGENGRDFFIIQEGGNKATVYMMPTETKHLSDADLKKYYDTVSGDQTYVTKTWKNELDNKDLVSVEMKELLDFKSRQGRYHHTKNTMVNNRPTIDANHHDEAFSTVRNFSVDELISNKELFEVSRTDLHAAYQNFSRYRMFDLLFQESIDQLAGSTGLRPKEFFRLIEEKIKTDADKLSQGMSIDSRAAIQKDIDDGMGRLVWQYAEYNGTISRSGSESRVGQNIARTVRGIATTSSGLGYGLSQSPETTMEILKNMPQTKGLSVPVGGFRYLTSLLKFWDRKDSATKMQVGDLITSLEEYSKDHSTHFNEGIADIDFDTDLNSPYRAIWNSGRNSEGMTGQMADFFQRTGQTAVLAGGVTDGTNLARYYGKARHVRDLTAMMRDGKLKEFLRLRALPENRAAMQKLLEGSFASAAEERKLWKMHKSLARQAKGLDPLLALKAIKAGLDNPAKLEAMMYGMNAANALDGILDFRDLHMVYRDLKNMKSPPIDPELYRAAATDFQYGVEALIRKRTVTHGFGLNKNLSVFNTQDEVGKLVNTLTSYMRSWFDDVALNAPERGAVGLMFGGILSVAVVETMISLLREWMSGREMEDMIAELENDPYEYVLKFVSRMPIFGVMTPVFEGLLKTAKYMSGGAQSGGSGLIDTLSQVGGGSPNIGINSAMSMLKTTGEAGTDLVTGAMEGDTQLMAKGALRVPGHFFNKTIYAAPVRIMEEQMDLDDKHTAQFIIDGLQKKPYRYLSQQRGGRRGGSSRAAPQAPSAVPVTTQTMPQSAALRNAQRPEMGRQVKEYVAPAPPSKPNSGVSERLGKLLDNPSYTPTPPM